MNKIKATGKALFLKYTALSRVIVEDIVYTYLMGYLMDYLIR